MICLTITWFVTDSYSQIIVSFWSEIVAFWTNYLAQNLKSKLSFIGTIFISNFLIVLKIAFNRFEADEGVYVTALINISPAIISIWNYLNLNSYFEYGMFILHVPHNCVFRYRQLPALWFRLFESLLMSYHVSFGESLVAVPRVTLLGETLAAAPPATLRETLVAVTPATLGRLSLSYQLHRR